MSTLARFRLMITVLPFVAIVAAAKVLVHRLGLEVVALDVLTPSLVAGAIFILGFLLAQVLNDFKESERLPSEMRLALEALNDDVTSYCRIHAGFDLIGFRQRLVDFVEALEDGLGVARGHIDLGGADRQLDRMTEAFRDLEQHGMSQRYLVRLRQVQDILRRGVYRISYVQKIQFVPSVQVLVQTLVSACLVLLVLVRSSGSWQPALVVGFVGYLFIYVLILIHKLEQPFRKGEQTVDDVSLYLLRDFAAKVAAQPDETSPDRHPAAIGAPAE